MNAFILFVNADKSRQWQNRRVNYDVPLSNCMLGNVYTIFSIIMFVKWTNFDVWRELTCSLFLVINDQLNKSAENIICIFGKIPKGHLIWHCCHGNDLSYIKININTPESDMWTMNRVMCVNCCFCECQLSILIRNNWSVATSIYNSEPNCDIKMI